MRPKTIKIFVLFLTVVFFADDIDVDIALAHFLTMAFHKPFYAINRDIAEDGNDQQTYKASNLKCGSTSVVAVDEDDPTTLETYFPAIAPVASTPETSEIIIATNAGFKRVSYLSLHTILI